MDSEDDSLLRDFDKTFFFSPASSSCRETGREEEEQEGSRENRGRELILAPVPRSLQWALALPVGERRGASGDFSYPGVTFLEWWTS